MNTDSTFGKKLKKHIKSDNERNYFILGENERCPFLNKDNLCDIITEQGEDYLCEICSEHPRFHNYFDDRIESGLGLCCEEAARIILTNPHKVKPENNDETTENSYYYEYRNKLFEIIQNRNIDIMDRIYQLIDYSDFKLKKNTLEEWAQFYLSLERLDNKWTELLSKLKSKKDSIFENKIICDFETVAEQIIVYFLYRYTPKAELEMSKDEWILFSVISCLMIFGICEQNNITNINGICQTARMYSQEIEYSDENIDIFFENILQ